jgi:hypothetical protein
MATRKSKSNLVAPLTLVTSESITKFANEDLELIKINVPELGGELYFAEPSTLSLSIMTDDKKSTVERAESLAQLLSEVVCDKLGKPLLSRDEYLHFRISRLHTLVDKVFDAVKSARGEA